MESSGRQERFRRNGALYEGSGVDWPWGQGLKHRQDGLFLKSECKVWAQFGLPAKETSWIFGTEIRGKNNECGNAGIPFKANNR